MLSVLISTYNGAEKLPDVLDAYLRLQPPRGGWELFIVDNGSTDQTGQIITSFRERLPLTCLFEPRRGKNFALNTALPKVTGDLVALTDDDTLPRPDWLAQLRLAADAHPECSIFGGVTLPRWQVPPEEWILSWVPPGLTYSITDPRLKEGPTTTDHIFGTNLAIRTCVFNAGYRFDPSIGPQGSSYPMGSETQLLRKLVRAGHRAWHCEEVVVEHIIEKSKMSREWALRRAIRFGRGQYRMAAEESTRPLRLWLGVPRHLIRMIPLQVLRVAWAALSGNARARFEARWQLSFLIGEAVEARVLYREGKTRAAEE